MMLNCIAVDDEKLALDLLEDNIRQLPYLRLVKRCRNAMEALQTLQEEKIDLIFLDIQMPSLSGIQLLRSLPEPPMTILITAYEHHALEGYALDIVDYLLKPVSLERFIMATNKAWERYKLKNQLGADDEFFVQADYSLVKVQTREIVYIEGLRDYIRIHYDNGEQLLVRMSMRAIEEKLPSRNFLRVHKSFIIPLSRISSIRKNIIHLDQRHEVPLGEQYRETLLSRIQSA